MCLENPLILANQNLTQTLSSDADCVRRDHTAVNRHQLDGVLLSRVQAIQLQLSGKVLGDAARRSDGLRTRYVRGVADLVVVECATNQSVPLDIDLGVGVGDHLQG